MATDNPTPKRTARRQPTPPPAGDAAPETSTQTKKPAATKTAAGAEPASRRTRSAPPKAAKADADAPPPTVRAKPRRKAGKKAPVTGRGLAVGAAATVGIIAAGVAATVGRAKIAKASTDVVDAIKTKLRTTKATSNASQPAATANAPKRRGRKPGTSRSRGKPS